MKRKPMQSESRVAAAFRKFTLGNAPGHLIRRAQQRHRDIFAEEVGAGGPTSRQFAVLLAVCQRPGRTQSELVEATGIDRSTLGDMLDRLVKRGDLQRRRVEGDNRSNALYATSAGRALLAGTLPRVVRAQARIMAAVPPTRRAVALEILRLLAGVGQKSDTESR
jgi:MarR family transcriptional regulator, temperature-dependent positive regulator of motility